ncbi:ABC transporter ATP-binding protein [Streptomyces sp. NEAU-sy36]|uniref:ATP-binding cassette domain-containing protein n=1 Tax=unclassified Streptomyces TaxID=2593676 RepID=UPI0015D608BB|nr:MULTISPECIES: ABC transporter ATP-binding protein [unclassified Streptomyces]QLJ02700.1 ABC transporter ATP-binding protein [Streptomyces sp. NEAU-sy36]
MTTFAATAVQAEGVGLRAGRGARRAELLADCTFRVPRGAVCGIVGPNGAGKSLLLSAAAGLIRPDEGRLTVLGQPAGEDALLGEVAFVDQHRPLYPRMRVADLLAMGRDLNPRWDPQRAAELLELGRIALGSRAGSLSGGQRSLLALALARGKRPRLLLLDEPLSDLDPLVRRAALGLLLGDVAEGGGTVLLSSHVLGDLEEAIDHLLLIDGGRIRLAGELSELLAAHRLLDRLGLLECQAGPAPWRVHPVDPVDAEPRHLTLVRVDQRTHTAAADAELPSLEELVVSYLRSPSVAGWLAPGMRPGLCGDGDDSGTVAA